MSSTSEEMLNTFAQNPWAKEYSRLEYVVVTE